MSNPFFNVWQTPNGIPPFSEIKPDHFEAAFTAGFKQNIEEINAIISCTENPTFSNTVEELERSGELLRRVEAVFFNLVLILF